MKFWPTACSEFPNDNPELHEGAVWDCLATGFRPRAVLRARPGSASRSAVASHNANERREAPDEQSDAAIASAALATEEAEPAVEVAMMAAEDAGVDEPNAASEQTHDSVELELPPDPFVEELMREALGDDTLESNAATNATTADLPAQAAADASAQPSPHDASALDALQPPNDETAPHSNETDLDDEAAVEQADAFVRELEELFGPSEVSTRHTSDVGSAPIETSLQADLMHTTANHTTASDSCSDQAATGEQQALPLDPSEAPKPNPLAMPAAREVLAPLAPLELDLGPLPPKNADWHRITSAAARYLLHRGATRAAALVPRILDGEHVTLSRLPQTVQDRLLGEQIAEETTSGSATTAEFCRRARRLRTSFLDGRVDAQTLTQWITVPIAAMLDSDDSLEGVMNELREAGVVAAIERAA